MTTAFPLMWTPKKIGKLEIRSRIVLTGHGTLMVKDSKVTDQLLAYYAERSRGGVGILMIGTQQVHPSSPGLGHLLANYDDSIIPDLKKIADAVHEHGARVFGYIGHFGAFAGAYPSPPWAPSPIYLRKFGTYAREMTRDDIKTIVDAHAAAAVRNIKAGMDGIEVHAGHGLLVNQFLSPLSNFRTDEYGGSLENRMRFPLEILRAVRKEIGPDVPLGCRVSGEELLEGGMKVDEMKLVVRAMVEAAAVDYVDVSMGNDTTEVSDMLHHPPMGFKSAPYAHIAREIREFTGIPVIHGTRINTPEVAEELIASGAADFAGMCRALIADPHLPVKARDNRTDEIIPCVACEQACIGHLERHQPISCVGNPVTSREAAWAIMKPAETAKRVVVIGGGPAGMEAATIAARRGHSVVLFEGASELGGSLRTAAKAPLRDTWTRLIEAKIRALHRAGVDVRLNTKVSVEDVHREKPDTVILATGSQSGKPNFMGGDLPNVFMEREVLNGRELPQGEVLVIDSVDYTSGVGVAAYLGKQGRSVTLVSTSPQIGNKLERPTRIWLAKLIAELGVSTLVDREVHSVSEKGVILRHTLTGELQTMASIGSVVVAAPPKPQRDLYDSLSAAFPDVRLIGDCHAPRTVEHAVLEGHTVGWAL